MYDSQWENIRFSYKLVQMTHKLTNISHWTALGISLYILGVS